LPVYRFLGADPAVFAGSLLALDMGGAPMARELTSDPAAASLGGVLTGAMLGCTVSFTLPVAMEVLPKEDRIYASQGILCGIITIPLGILAGGLTAGYGIGMLLRNLVPVILMAGLIAFGLWKAERWILKLLAVFGKGITIIAAIGLVAAAVKHLTGITLIPGMAPVQEAFVVIGEIALVLMGALPFLHFINQILGKLLIKVGEKLRMNSVAVSGLVASLANSIPAFGMIKDMDPRGKVINMAFAVSGAFVFGDHMAFTAGFAPEMVSALIVGKLVGGITAVAAALLYLNRSGEKCARQTTA
jgi:ethanolamine transporter